jgi:hypothetical protein
MEKAERDPARWEESETEQLCYLKRGDRHILKHADARSHLLRENVDRTVQFIS